MRAQKVSRISPPTRHRFARKLSALRRIGAHASIVLALFCHARAWALLPEYQTTVLNEASLISYYTFDQTNAVDMKGVNDGTLMGTTAFATGTGGFGTALSLASGAGRVNLGVVEEFAFADETGSIEAWVKPSSFKDPATILANRDGYSRWDVYMTGNKMGIGMWNGYGNQVIAIPSAGTAWHHLVVVFDNGEFKVYWDGALAGSTFQALGYTDFTKSTQIGSRTPWGTEAENWVGMLDEVAIYSDALTPEAVQAHYDAFFAGNPPVITRQPQGGTFIPGAALTLSVAATGPNLAYQWYKGATALSGMTSNTLVFPSLGEGDLGTYSVTVSNSTLAVASDPVTIALAPLPTPLVRYQTTISNEASLISYYTFDRLLPEDVFGPNQGTLAGTADWGTGIGGGSAKGLKLDGSGHLRLGSVSALDFPSGDGTVEGWIRADWTNASGYPCMFADRNGSYGAANWSLHLGSDRGSLTFFNGSSSEIWGVAGVSTNWHHYAMVFTGGSATVYWDGVPLSAPRARPLGGIPETVQLGSSTDVSTTEGWVGMLDEVAFYSTALDAASIQAHYNAYFVGEPPVITGQPVGGNFLVGRPFQMSVSASGAYLTYQWYKDNILIPDATNSVIGSGSLTRDNSGTYYVTVTNPLGSTNSATATVIVGNDMARYQATVLAESNLISYYTFDGGDGQDAVNAHPGAIANAAAFVAGPGDVTNLSLSLDGTGHLDLGQVSDFDFSSGSGTVEGWIRPDWVNPAPYDPCLFADRDADGSVWSVHMSRWRTEIGNFSSGYQTLPIGSDSGWHHYAIVFDTGTVSMYWDGRLRGGFNQAINSSLAKTTQIGSSTPTTTSEGWMGGLDEVAFYSAALDEQTILRHFLAMVGPPSLSFSLVGTQLTLSWPEDDSGYTLEYAENLPGTSWVEVGGVVNNQVTVDASMGTRYFRLRK